MSLTKKNIVTSLQRLTKSWGVAQRCCSTATSGTSSQIDPVVAEWIRNAQPRRHTLEFRMDEFEEAWEPMKADWNLDKTSSFSQMRIKRLADEAAADPAKAVEDANKLFAELAANEADTNPVELEELPQPLVKVLDGEAVTDESFKEAMDALKAWDASNRDKFLEAGKEVSWK